MKIDVDGIQGFLDLYRSALDNKIPVAPALAEHFSQNRTSLMQGFTRIASAQRQLLRCMSPENEHEFAQLEEAKRIVDEFSHWADGG